MPPVHVLIVEDREEDAELVMYQLRKARFDVTWKRVQTEVEFLASLYESIDIILADYSLPEFDARRALELLGESKLDIPFIVVSGTVGEDIAISMMKAGAHDYLLKDNLSRLAPAVERELGDARARRERREVEERFSKVFQSSPIAISISTLDEGRIVDVNPRALQLLGYTREELVGRRTSEVDLWFTPDGWKQVIEEFRQQELLEGLEIEYHARSGATRYGLLSLEMIDLAGQPGMLAMVQDVTDRRIMEQRLEESEQQFRLLAENASDMISRHNEIGEFIYVSPACLPLLGYEQHELLGRNPYELFHPDDIPAITISHQTVLQRRDTYTVAYRMRRKDGTYAWLETSTRAIRHPQTGEIIDLQAVSRDISERKQAEVALTYYANRLELLLKIDRAILAAEDPQEIARTVLEYLQGSLGFDGACVRLLDDEERRTFTTLACLAALECFCPGRDDHVFEAMQRNEIYYVPDLRQLATLTENEQRLVDAGLWAYVCVPLFANGSLIGKLHLRSRQPNSVSTQALDITREVAASLAIALENARLLQVEQRRNQELTVLHRASVQLTSSLHLETVLDTILDFVVSLVKSDEAHIFLYNGATLSFGAAQWDGKRQPEPLAAPRPDGLMYTVARSGTRMIVRDVAVHPNFQNWRAEGALIGLPLRVAHELNGVMSLAFAEPRNFDDHEILLLELLADQAAIAIHNAQLYRQIHNYASEMERRVQERTAELQASETKYRTLIEFAPDPIIIADLSGTITLANRRTEETFGYRQDELIGQSIEILVPERLHAAHTAHRGYYSQHPTKRVMGATLELVAKHQDGRELPVKIGLSPIETGNETLIMAYIIDITTDKQLEVSLREALAREIELNELKTQFVSTVSHEFRTPLSVIQTSTDILNTYFDRMDESRRANHLNKILAQIDRMVVLLNDVLTISRADAGAQALHFVPLNVNKFCQDLVEEIRITPRMKHNLIYSCADPELIVTVDEKLLHQAVVNLLTNAFKYSPEGSDVHLEAYQEGEHIMIRVRDHGIGIPEVDQPRLFEMFHRARNVGTIEGTGLGLAIVKRSIDALGGTITLESRVGEGTTIAISLPT